MALIQVSGISGQTHKYIHTDTIVKMYAATSGGTTDWYVQIEASGNNYNPAMGVTQSEAEDLVDEIAIAIGVDWKP